MLYIDSYNTSTADRTALVPLFAQVFPTGIDVYDMNRSNNLYIPRNWNLTFLEYMKLYKRIFWSSDNLSLGSGNAIELGAVAIQNYLNYNGKILVSISSIPKDFNSPIYQIAPFDSISTKINNQRGSYLANFKSYPTIENASNIDSLSYKVDVYESTPAYVKSGAKTLLKTKIIDAAGGTWTGPNIIAAATNGANGKPNQIFFTTDVHNLNGNPASLVKFFQFVFNQLFAD